MCKELVDEPLQQRPVARQAPLDVPLPVELLEALNSTGPAQGGDESLRGGLLGLRDDATRRPWKTGRVARGGEADLDRFHSLWLQVTFDPTTA